METFFPWIWSSALSSIEKTGNEDQMDMLISIIEGDRLRDISDLPFDLAT